ncbi:MAG TPA: hypothetical protein VLE49_12325, partial [Anaerolineales bacterium]|nr:hypothetical protein [Anaerolineales bacterium]
MMNDKFTDNERAEDIAQKLDQVAERTNVNPQFAAELEERLRSAHRPKTSWLMASFQRVSPVVVWVALIMLLGLVLSLSISTLIPAPQPAKNNTPVEHATPTPSTDNSAGNKTPGPNGESFDYDGAKLILSVPLPDAPGQANVYTLLAPEPPTVEYAQTLATQLGIDGEIYTAEGHSPGVSALMVTDGKQQLIVYGSNDYTYTSDMVTSSRYFEGFQNENAETIIGEYLKAHDLDFNYKFISSSSSAYYLVQLAPDGSS